MSHSNRVTPSPSHDQAFETHPLQAMDQRTEGPQRASSGQKREDDGEIIGEYKAHDTGSSDQLLPSTDTYDYTANQDNGSIGRESPDVPLQDSGTIDRESPDVPLQDSGSIGRESPDVPLQDNASINREFPDEPLQDNGSINRESPDVPLPVYTDDTEDTIVHEEGHKIEHDKLNIGQTGPHNYERIYTPALPKAESLEETMYQSPTPPPQTPQEAQEQTTPLVIPPPRLPPPEKRTSNLSAADSFGQSSPRVLPPIGANKISPADDYTVHRAEVRQRSAGNQRSNAGMSDNVMRERKKSLVIGSDDNTDGPGCCGWILYIFSILLIIVTLPFSLVFTIKVVQEYERAVIFRLGRLPVGGAKGPGIFFIIPCIESYTKVDLRTVSFDVPPQEVLTKDSVTVSVDAVVYYRVSNPTVSVANVENAHHSTRLLAQTTLRNILGTKNMSEILSDRESISHGMQSSLDEATEGWGIKVERVEIKDVRLPVQLQRAMAAEAEASREARAKVIAAEGEHKAATALKGAADIMGENGAALQLRYLQTLNSISAEKNSTIIFPIPIDILSTFLSKGK